MESDEESCSEFEEPAQILYDIVPYKEWEQEPEVPIVHSDGHILIWVGNRPIQILMEICQQKWFISQILEIFLKVLFDLTKKG